jgi:hypothetical protein
MAPIDLKHEKNIYLLQSPNLYRDRIWWCKKHDNPRDRNLTLGDLDGYFYRPSPKKDVTFSKYLLSQSIHEPGSFIYGSIG